MKAVLMMSLYHFHDDGGSLERQRREEAGCSILSAGQTGDSETWPSHNHCWHNATTPGSSQKLLK